MKDETLRNGRILLVDDEVACLCLLESVFNRLGFRNLRKLADPRRILEEVDAWQPDLIITDISMPEVDGIRLVEMVRSHLPPEDCVPILVLTGSTDAMAKRNSLFAGATDILFKPFDSSEMLMRTRNLLRTRFQHMEIQDQNRVLEQKVTERTAELKDALSELKTSQQQVVQRERFRAFGEMAGGVVHDFNNSLMSVIGYSELLLSDAGLRDDRDTLESYLRMMNTAGRDAAQVVSRLRDFYRPRENGDVFTTIEINDLIEEVVPLTKHKWHAKGLENGRQIHIELELQRVPIIHGNSAELREVLTNLIFNSVDAMPEGGTITLRSVADENSVIIEVADTGVGMTEEVRERCMEPFFSTKGDHGTGLGLSMTFGIIRRHEGSLDIETEKGRGTTFRLIFPIHVPSALDDTHVQLTLNRSLRVLVVDDELNARDVVTQYLRSDGHRVTTASNGNQAVERVMAEEFDLVITDHGMPGMNGIELANTVRRIDADKSVILLTGFALTSEQQPASVNCILKKPLVPDALRSALQQVMNGKPDASPVYGTEGWSKSLKVRSSVPAV